MNPFMDLLGRCCPGSPGTAAHLGGACLNNPDFNTFMPDVWARLIVDYDVKSVLDVGCGAGWSTAWFIEHGLRALGIEGDPAAVAARKCDAVLEHDFTLGPAPLTDEFDLGWSAEFLEHVEERYMPNWMAGLQRCKLVVVTHALKGQGGTHHVNENTTEYWVAKFDGFGFDHVPEETAKLRATSKGEPWGRNTLTFFRRR